MTPIPAAELTVDTSVGEVDLLCYGLPLSRPPELEQLLGLYREWRTDTGRAVVRGLRELGCEIDEDGFMDLARTHRPAHVVDRQGLTQVKGEVLRSYLLETGRIAGSAEFNDFGRASGRGLELKYASQGPFPTTSAPLARLLLWKGMNDRASRSWLAGLPARLESDVKLYMAGAALIGFTAFGPDADPR